MNLPKRITTNFAAGFLAALTMVTPAFAISGTVSADGGLRMRNGAGTDAGIITTIPNGSQVEISAVTEEGWFQIVYLNNTGFVSGEYLIVNDDEAAQLAVVENPVYGRVTEGPLNVRSAPSTDGERVKQLSAGSIVEIVEELEGWYAIEGGYVSADYIRIVDASEALSAGNGAQVVEYAMQFLGCPYVYGGTSPRGFDCSGFVKYVYSNFGLTLNRTASAQMDHGVSVSISELVPGDVVFFKKAGSSASRASHVGIYIGGGQFIHASTSTTGVIISDMDYAYYTTGFVGGRRLV